MKQFYCVWDYILCGLGLSLLGLTVIYQQSQYKPVLVWRTGQDLEIINPFMKVRREERDREFSSSLFCWHSVAFCYVWARLYGTRSGKRLLWLLHVLILLHMPYAPHSGLFSALLKGPSAEGILPPSHSTSRVRILSILAGPSNCKGLFLGLRHSFKVEISIEFRLGDRVSPHKDTSTRMCMSQVISVTTVVSDIRLLCNFAKWTRAEATKSMKN